MNVLLVGPPGAGKGTQAAILEARTGMKHIASGDLLRGAMQEQTALGLQARSFVDRGELVPDDLVIELIRERIGRADCSGGVLFDGFPRTIDQAGVLEDLLATQGLTLAAVIYLNVPREVLLKRIVGRIVCRGCYASYNVYYAPSRTEGICDLCRDNLYERSDDNWETARHRLDVYMEQTLPLIDYYRTRQLLLEIDGNLRMENVTEDMVAGLQRRMS